MDKIERMGLEVEAKDKVLFGPLNTMCVVSVT